MVVEENYIIIKQWKEGMGGFFTNTLNTLSMATWYRTFCKGPLKTAREETCYHHDTSKTSFLIIHPIDRIVYILAKMRNGSMGHRIITNKHPIS